MFEPMVESDASNQVAQARPPLQVVSVNNSFHLVATAGIREGALVFVIDGHLTHRASRYSVQIDHDSHIDVPEPLPFEIMATRHPWRFMNHSCEPNTRISGRTVTALRDIRAGEQVTFHYNTTEWDMAEGFRCHCGTPSCQGQIRGYKFLSPEARARLGDRAAKYLTRR